MDFNLPAITVFIPLMLLGGLPRGITHFNIPYMRPGRPPGWRRGLPDRSLLEIPRRVYRVPPPPWGPSTRTLQRVPGALSIEYPERLLAESLDEASGEIPKGLPGGYPGEPLGENWRPPSGGPPERPLGGPTIGSQKGPSSKPSDKIQKGITWRDLPVEILRAFPEGLSGGITKGPLKEAPVTFPGSSKRPPREPLGGVTGEVPAELPEGHTRELLEGNQEGPLGKPPDKTDKIWEDVTRRGPPIKAPGELPIPLRRPSTGPLQEASEAFSVGPSRLHPGESTKEPLGGLPRKPLGGALGEFPGVLPWRAPNDFTRHPCGTEEKQWWPRGYLGGPGVNYQSRRENQWEPPNGFPGHTGNQLGEHQWSPPIREQAEKQWGPPSDPPGGYHWEPPRDKRRRSQSGFPGHVDRQQGGHQWGPLENPSGGPLAGAPVDVPGNQSVEPLGGYASGPRRGTQEEFHQWYPPHEKQWGPPSRFYGHAGGHPGRYQWGLLGGNQWESLSGQSGVTPEGNQWGLPGDIPGRPPGEYPGRPPGRTHGEFGGLQEGEHQWYPPGENQWESLRHAGGHSGGYQWGLPGWNQWRPPGGPLVDTPVGPPKRTHGELASGPIGGLSGGHHWGPLERHSWGPLRGHQWGPLVGQTLEEYQRESPGGLAGGQTETPSGGESGRWSAVAVGDILREPSAGPQDKLDRPPGETPGWPTRKTPTVWSTGRKPDKLPGRSPKGSTEKIPGAKPGTLWMRSLQNVTEKPPEKKSGSKSPKPNFLTNVMNKFGSYHSIVHNKVSDATGYVKNVAGDYYTKFKRFWKNIMDQRKSGEMF